MKKIICACLAIMLICLTALASAEPYVYTEPLKIVKLPRSTPVEKNIITKYLFDMLDAFDRRGIEMHGIEIAVEGEVIFEAFWAPYDEDTPHIVHSLTKIFTNSAALLAVSQGYLTLDTRMIDILPEYVPADGPLENQDKVTLANLLNMTAGYGRMISGSEWRPLQTSWLEAFFQEPIPYEPGTFFQYSSGNPYAVSAMIQKTTGMTTEAYLMQEGFHALEMRNFSWDLSPEGITSGGNGVAATVEDLLKVGQLYLNGGSWNGRQILDPDLVHLAIGSSGKITEGQRSYAMHWTDSRKGYYSASGSYGQLIIIVPDMDMVISCTAGTKGDPARVFYDCLIAPTRADRKAGITVADDDDPAALAAKTSTLSLLRNPVFTASPVGELIDGHIYQAEENPYGISSVLLDIQADQIAFTMTDDRGTHTIVNGIDQWIAGDASMTGSYMHHQYQRDSEPVLGYAEWQTDTELHLLWRYPEMAFVDEVILSFTDDGQRASLVRTVNVNSGELETTPITLRME